MSFKDIKGQDRAIEIVKERIKQKRLTGAYLFVGPEGVGKKLFAKTMAKVLNCEEEGIDSCDKCPSCVKIDKEEHCDFHTIAFSSAEDASDAIKIEVIRQLQKNISLRSYEGKKKIFVINDAHKLTEEAANAFLKTLEEPPGDSLIILITSKPQLLFNTIVSRCQSLKFYSLSRPVMNEILRRDYLLESELAHFLSYFSEGRIGYALALKEADVLREKNKIIDEFFLSGKSSPRQLPITEKKQLQRYLNILTAWFRDIYLIKEGISYSELINLDRKEELLRMAGRYSFSDLSGVFNSISDSLLYLQQNVNIRLLLSNLKADLWKK